MSEGKPICVCCHLRLEKFIEPDDCGCKLRCPVFLMKWGPANPAPEWSKHVPQWFCDTHQVPVFARLSL